MPKLKTNKTAASRLSMSGTGKIMRAQIGKSHLRRNKSKRTKSHFSETMPISPRDKTRMRRLLPYGIK
ncbi:MAG: 50S ribosomal protein L35 [Chloroflexota bacterium]